jgi:outer membrane PBP1 activator LpoA protein
MLQILTQRLARGILLLTPLLLLISCQTAVVTKPISVGKTTAEDILIAQQYEEDLQWEFAAEMYRYLADRSVQPERSAYLQKVGLMLYRAQSFEEIEPYYQSLAEEDLLEPQTIQRDILLAGSYFNEGKIYQALGNLPDLEMVSAPDYKALALSIRSQGVLAIGKPLESAQLRIQIGEYLETDFEQRQNEDFIWEALNRISEPKIIKALQQQNEADLRGWLELNLIARRSNMIPAKLEPWLEQWHNLYDGHPAQGHFVEELLAESRLIYINPTRIALLLPFSGKLKPVAEAIQNGFLLGYYADQEEKPILEVINISSDPQEFFIQYTQAIQNGADFIVGPLDKKLVNELLLNEALKVPTLTLNYADDDSYGVNNLYQFGLRPEDEAEQIADYALVSGHYHALTLTPDNSLGQRLSEAFQQRFESLGGQVVDSVRYPAASNDYSGPITRLLNLRDSESRHAILDQVLRQKSEFIPRRRQDVDMIFITGNPRQARSIKPQLKFHHAKDLPVYATSSISPSRGNPDADRDLDEILFVDTPWTLQSEQNQDFQAITRLWPKQSQRYAKFFALGIDAYRMIPSLRRLMISPGEALQLNTGTIRVDKMGRIHRELILATYEKGRAAVLKQSVESVEETTDQ